MMGIAALALASCSKDEITYINPDVQKYETAFIDKKNKTFNKLAVTTDKSGNSIVIKDKAGNTRRVVTEKAGLFNLMAREYTYSTTDKSKATIIHNSSSAVVHLIDGPLCVEN